MLKPAPNASNSYSQLTPKWYNLRQPLKPVNSNDIEKNVEKKTKIALLFQFIAPKILSIYATTDPIDATYTTY